MRRLMTTNPAVIGGDPVNNDLQPMTDDEGPAAPTRQFEPEWRDDTEAVVYPLGPDPAWVNAEWQDILWESDTFVDAPAPLPSVPLRLTNSRWLRSRDKIELRGRWREVCEHLARRDRMPQS
jgi:hypothetical protein